MIVNIFDTVNEIAKKNCQQLDQEQQKISKEKARLRKLELDQLKYGCYIKKPDTAVEEFVSILYKSNLNEKQFGQKIGLTREQINRIKNGKKRLTNELYIKVKETFQNKGEKN